MRTLRFLTGAVVVLGLALVVRADDGAHARNFHAALIGYQEVPSVATVAHGDFHARISKDETTIEWDESWDGLQAPVTQSHIHVGRRAMTGSIVIWLCGTATNPGPAGTQSCPQSGKINGVITSTNVIAGSTASQQLKAGDLEAVIAAIRAGAAYANVHSNLSPGGEIRGQLRASDDHDHHDR